MPDPVADLYDRWDAHRREHALEKEAIIVARDLQDRALKLASEDINRRLEGMNELRVQIAAERAAYLTRNEYEAKHEAMLSKLEVIESALRAKNDDTRLRLSALESTYAGLAGRLAIIAGLSGFAVSVIVTVLLKLLKF